ncbi:hypothetical protein K439DRAFT_1621576 [Ramaria rubella]|nr:hypothetical protein K439DRAFT_1621576 [Ramaria rubella]
MLTLDPSSHCDVCCESFSSLPHCIDCGHVFCENCLDSLCEKTWSPRQSPVCPFCREPFTKASVRKIRVDLKTPRPPIREIEPDDDYGKLNIDLPPPSEARRLEEKVAKAAASKCSFEEVSELHKEIQQWLASEVKRTSAGQHASLQLSAALLRAILLNCLAYSEASKVAKSVETSLKERLDTTTLIKEQLEAELRKHRTLYTQKVRECQELRSEVNRLKLTTTVPGNSAGRPLTLGFPPRSPSSPSPLSRSSTVRSTMTPPPQPIQRSYFPRPASTTPTLSNMSHNNSRSLVVGSAPTSNTLASAMKFQTSPSKSRSVSSRSVPPPDDDKLPERWIPASDDESVTSEKRFSSDRFSYGPSSADRSVSTSSSHPKWMPRFQLPPVTV